MIARILDGDRVAGRQLYEAHATRVHRLVYRLCGDAELAQDFTQDTFVRAFDQLSRFRGDAAFGTWIHRIAVTVTLNGMRKVKRLRERETTLDDDQGLGTVSHRADPDSRSRIAAAIDALPEGTRMTLIMHDIEGYTHAEIAESSRHRGGDEQVTVVRCARQAPSGACGVREGVTDMTDGRRNGRTDS